MKIDDVIKLDEKISDDDKARIRKAMGPNKDANVKPLIKLTPGWGDKGKSMKAGYGKIAKSPEEMDEGWKDFFKGTDAERRQERRDIDAYKAMRLDKETAKFEKQGLSADDARKYAYRKVYGAPQTEAKQKPYVSSDSDGKHVMTASGKIAKTFKDMDSANAYLKKHYDDLLGDDIKEAQDALRQRYNQLDELESQAAATAKGLVPQAARNAFNAVTGGIKGALTGKGVGASARKNVQGAKTQTQIARIARDVVARWNQKTSANPDFQTDRELYKFIAQYWKHTPEDERPSPPKGAGRNPKQAEAYIQQIISNELAHGEFGQKEQPQQQGQQQQGQQQATEIPQGMKQTTQTDPKKIPKGTMFTVYQAKGPGGKGGKEVMYRWEGGQWTLNTGSGKWQAGQIKNDLAFKLYLDAVKNGKAMSPIAGDPDAGAAYVDPNTGKKVDPDAPAGQAQAGAQAGQAQAGAQAGQAQAGDTAAQVDANKDGKDDNTGEPMKPTDNAQAQGDGDAQAQQAGAVDPKRLEGAMNSIKTANSASLSALEELLKIEKAA